MVNAQVQSKKGAAKQGQAQGASSGSGGKPHYLTVVTFNRLFPEDISNFSAYECIQVRKKFGTHRMTEALIPR